MSVQIIIKHCKDCHHEWEACDTDDGTCDWCGGESYIISESSWNIALAFKKVIKNLNSKGTKS